MDRLATRTPLDLQVAGRLIGSYRWTEKQLFHLLGSWAESAAEAPVKLFLDQQSFEYAWHAELWADRLPDHRGVDTAGLTAPASNGIAALFRSLFDSSAELDSVERLAIVYRVLLPRLVGTYSAHLERPQMAGSDPTQRALRLILADELSAWRAGETQLQKLLVDSSSVQKAARKQLEIELAIVEAGGLGLLST